MIRKRKLLVMLSLSVLSALADPADGVRIALELKRGPDNMADWFYSK